MPTPPSSKIRDRSALAGLHGSSAASIRLIREMRRRWCAYRIRGADLRRRHYIEPPMHYFRVAAQRLMAVLRIADRLLSDPPARNMRKQARKRFHALRRDQELSRLHSRGLSETTSHHVFPGRIHHEQTEGMPTLMRQRNELERFGTTLQYFHPSSNAPATTAT